jgi:hypothetical protein
MFYSAVGSIGGCHCLKATVTTSVIIIILIRIGRIPLPPVDRIRSPIVSNRDSLPTTAGSIGVQRTRLRTARRRLHLDGQIILGQLRGGEVIEFHLIEGVQALGPQDLIQICAKFVGSRTALVHESLT